MIISVKIVDLYYTRGMKQLNSIHSCSVNIFVHYFEITNEGTQWTNAKMILLRTNVELSIRGTPLFVPKDVYATVHAFHNLV